MEACSQFMAFIHDLCLRWRHESDINARSLKVKAGADGEQPSSATNDF